MNPRRILLILCGLIAALAAVAAATGVLWQGGGESFNFISVRGQPVLMRGSGLYHFDSAAAAAQAIAQDLVTLGLGSPLLLAAMYLTARNSLRGRVLLAGTLGYFLYTYTALSVMAAYNELFLVYVALFSLSLFAFVLAVQAINVDHLTARLARSFPRRAIAGFLFFLGGMLALLWLGRIVPALLNGTPPIGLESYTTLVIQALDLGIIVPAAILTGVLLLRRVPIGYLLAAVVLVLGFTMGAALTAMVIGQGLAGVAMSVAEIVMFPVFALIDSGLMVALLRSIQPGQSGQDIAPRPAPDAQPPRPGRPPGEYRPVPDLR
jgi:hypothetical protein